MLLLSIYKTIKNLLSRKPVEPPKARRLNTKHAWAADALKHVTGPGMFLIQVPASIDIRLARSAVMARLADRFPGRNRVSTSIRTRKNHIQIVVK